jgi:hypothetical protein
MSAAYFYAALLVTKGMLSKTPGAGQAYLGSFRDKEGHAFDGAKSYRLHVPPNVPARCRGHQRPISDQNRS